MVLKTIVKAHETIDPSDYWAYLHTHEQLISCMSNGDAFVNFREAQSPCFAPSYRRERGDRGNCKGYKSLETLQNAFTTQVISKKGKVGNVFVHYVVFSFLSSF